MKIKKKTKKRLFSGNFFFSKSFFLLLKVEMIKNISFFFSSTGSENFNFSSVSVFAPETDSFSFQILPKDSGSFYFLFNFFEVQ